MLPNEILRGQLDELRRAMAESQRQVAEAHQKVKALHSTTYTPDRSISVSVDGTGVVRAITFHDDEYLEMEPEELGGTLVALLAQAQTDVRSQVLDLMPPSPFLGVTPRQLLDPDTDPGSLVPKDLLSDLLGGPSQRSPQPQRPQED